MTEQVAAIVRRSSELRERRSLSAPRRSADPDSIRLSPLIDDVWSTLRSARCHELSITRPAHFFLRRCEPTRRVTRPTYRSELMTQSHPIMRLLLRTVSPLPRQGPQRLRPWRSAPSPSRRQGPFLSHATAKTSGFPRDNEVSRRPQEFGAIAEGCEGVHRFGLGLREQRARVINA